LRIRGFLPLSSITPLDPRYGQTIFLRPSWRLDLDHTIWVAFANARLAEERRQAQSQAPAA
jgi:hypothetical protein